ncbi:unnamed protein product [Periconia digitata]|uniref:Carotenoid oxygenase n=1 Tax=Periconia digitata TaxID=1303443 RepID=A0A9W4UL09_9PLEO|nr:unnamed protein product [Periconia digitata]
MFIGLLVAQTRANYMCRTVHHQMATCFSPNASVHRTSKPDTITSTMTPREEISREHPYLAGNFAPVTKTTPPVPISYTGTIPKELHGGMYVRNGGNPITNSNLGRDAHWFDGDGMLTGVWFERSNESSTEAPIPHFVNQLILTDLAISSLDNKRLTTPILPSIATLVNPLASLALIVWRILRSVFLVLLSHLPGSPQAIKRISVANTSIVYHDGRALATCESGPPIRVHLPGLETVGWYNGNQAEGEFQKETNKEPGFGGTGLNSWMREWTTGHPKVDPTTGEMLLFHCNFLPPFVHYSVVPKEDASSQSTKLLNAPVPGCSGGKMMHDFGVSKNHSVILDLPLTLSPFNLLKNHPIVSYEPHMPSRFGVFPRHDPDSVRWFETKGCCIFHTANTWDELDAEGNTTAVNMLACRLTSASLVFSAGNIVPPPNPERSTQRPLSFFAKYDDDEADVDVEKVPPPTSTEKTPLLPPSAHAPSTQASSSSAYGIGGPAPPIPDNDEEEQCRLYYYRFSLDTSSSNNIITHQHALSIIPFEFPTLHPSKEMQDARYIYGCSTSSASFGAALGKATKIDVLVKMDVHSLLARQPTPSSSSTVGSEVNAVVDRRNVDEILSSNNPHDDIKAFRLPERHFAQEARFVPRQNASGSEDDGYLLFYVFDETQLSPLPSSSSSSSPPPTKHDLDALLESATSELWILDAKDMATVVCKVHLPARVPYGLHGNWFSEAEVSGQRDVKAFRSLR